MRGIGRASARPAQRGLSVSRLERALAATPRSALRQALRGRPFPLASGNRPPVWCRLAHVHADLPVAAVPMIEIEPQVLQTALERHLRSALTDRAVNHLSRADRALSARDPVWPAQAMVLLAGLALVAALALSAPVMASALAGLAFLSLSALKLAAVAWRIASPRREPPPLVVSGNLPVYTVLVPLYREGRIVPRLLDALNRLDYPRDRLDVKLVTEEGDHDTHNALASHVLPPWITVVRVPAGGPKTKPKALNVALAFARGDYVVVYDAEDVPARDQLLRAVAAFASLPARIVCLQARLAFHSAGHNWLTRQYALEYAMLFDGLLPLLSRSGLPFPLGGTSNHFRIEGLRAVGGWDPFNVTEDADLGYRLARLGYAARTLDSVTLEEPTVALRPWLRQRSRWMKGFLQTWLVLMRSPPASFRGLGLAGFVVMNLLLAGSVLAAVAHPWLLGLLVWEAMTGAVPAGLAVLAAGHLMAVLAPLLYIADRDRLKEFATAAFTVPLHWFLVSAATHCAIVEFAIDPFRWNKTDHGSLIARGFSPGEGSASSGDLAHRGRIEHGAAPASHPSPAAAFRSAAARAAA